jgi:hypothetical protein
MLRHVGQIRARASEREEPPTAGLEVRINGFKQNPAVWGACDCDFSAGKAKLSGQPGSLGTPMPEELGSGSYFGHSYM